MGLLMAGTVKVPGVGEVKKTYVWIGAAATAGILAVAYYRHRNAANAAAANAATPVTGDTSQYDPNAIDPNTGLTYAQEAASGQIGAQEGGVSGYGGSYYGSGNIVGYDQYGMPIYSTGIAGNNVYNTNADWATAAENQLQAQGVDYQTAANAISRILAGLSVTSQQQDLFMEAVGQLGQPPQGYPKPIKLQNAPTGPGSPSGSAAPPGAASMAANPPGNLHVVQVSTNFAEIQWNAVANAKSYTVKSSPGGQFSTNNTIANLGSLKRKTRYTVQVWANPTKTGGPHSTVTFTTK